MRRKEEKHNLSESRLYRIWKNMRQRCINPKASKYELYGGRGVKVCNKWLNSFLGFFEDVGMPPSDKHQLDRINSDGNYVKENVRWVLPRINSIKVRARKNKKCPYKGVVVHFKRNKPYQARITFFGKTQSLGYFKTAEEAAARYNLFAANYFGENAVLNNLYEIQEKEAK